MMRPERFFYITFAAACGLEGGDTRVLKCVSLSAIQSSAKLSGSVGDESRVLAIDGRESGSDWAKMSSNLGVGFRATTSNGPALYQGCFGGKLKAR